MGMTTVTRNYQITLPKDIRAREGINVGDSLLVDIKGDVIEIRKAKAEIGSAFGAWKKLREDSVEYVRMLRKDSEKRMKRLGL